MWPGTGRTRLTRMTASPPTSSHGGPDGSRPACSPRLLCGCPSQNLLLHRSGRRHLHPACLRDRTAWLHRGGRRTRLRSVCVTAPVLRLDFWADDPWTDAAEPGATFTIWYGGDVGHGVVDALARSRPERAGGDAPRRLRWGPVSTYAPKVSEWTSLRTCCSAPCRW